jgi:hypothetical protein
MSKFGEESAVRDVMEIRDLRVVFEFSARFVYLNSLYVFRPAKHCHPRFHRLHWT